MVYIKYIITYSCQRHILVYIKAQNSKRNTKSFAIANVSVIVVALWILDSLEKESHNCLSVCRIIRFTFDQQFQITLCEIKLCLGFLAVLIARDRLCWDILKYSLKSTEVEPDGVVATVNERKYCTQVEYQLSNISNTNMHFIQTKLTAEMAAYQTTYAYTIRF